MARPFCFAALFLGFCLSGVTLAGGPAAVPGSTPRQVQRTVERAIAYLQTESGGWVSQGRCASCHHVAMPLWALSEAGRQGYAIDRKFLADTGQATLGSMQKMIASQIVPNPAAPRDPRPMARGVNIGAVFMAVAAQSLPAIDEGQRQSLRWIARQAISKQRQDGSWEFFLSRPPINESQATDAAWILMALQGEAGPDTPESQREALKKGLAWLASAESADNDQVKLLKLLLGLRAGEPRGTLQPSISQLLARQRPDGGWSQTAVLPSDAFATGQTLYVLSLAGYTTRDPAIKRAIDLLVATQKPDGAWPMKSRASPDGRPGAAKLLTPITCAATAWATMGLARLAPEKPPSPAKPGEALNQADAQGK